MQSNIVKKTLKDEDNETALFQLREALLRHTVLKARDDFYVFVKLFAPYLIPGGEFVDNWHIKFICEQIQTSLRAGGGARLMIFAPPGSMKSLICSVCLPLWFMGRDPTQRVIQVGHTTELSEGWGRLVRDVIMSPEYQSIFPKTVISKESGAAGRWHTTRKGGYLAAGATKPIAGFRANLIVADDLLSEQTAISKLEREKVNENWYQGIESRLLPYGHIIIINTRWHPNDLSGFLLKKEEEGTERHWKVISIPALLEDDDMARKLGLAVGGSYWPTLWPSKIFLEKKSKMSVHSWNAVYMQKPTADEGNIFKEEWFQWWESDEPPECKYIVQVMDTAFSKKESADYSALQLWGVFEKEERLSSGEKVRQNHMILLAAKKDRYEFPELCDVTQAYYDEFGPDAIVIEKKASGQSLLQEFRRRGLPVMDWTPDKDKESRAHASVPFVSNGRVWLPRKSWARELVASLGMFPKGEHDDDVDAFTMAVLWLRDTYNLESDYYPLEEPKKKVKRVSYWKSVLA